MTIATLKSSKTGQGNGLATNWPYDFPIPGANPADQSNVTVTVVDTTVTPATQTQLANNLWSISGVGDFVNFGAVTYPLAGGAPLIAGQFLTIGRAVPATQPTHLINGSNFYAASVEAALDWVVMAMQEAVTQAGGTLRSSVADPGAALNPIPVSVLRANMFLAFDANGQPIASPGAAATPVNAAMVGLVQAVSIAAARAFLGSGALGDAIFTAATAQAARLTLGIAGFVAPLASPYNMTLADAGRIVSSELAGGALIANLAAGATYGVGGSITFYRKTNNLTINTNGADRIRGVNGAADLATLLLVNDGDNFTIEWDGAGWEVIIASPYVWTSVGVTPLKGFLAGGTVSNDGVTPNTKLQATATQCTDDAFGVLFAVPAGAIDCTVVGLNGIDAGALAASASYHIFAIAKPGGQAGGYLISTSLNAPTLPAGYTLKRRIASWRTDSLSHLRSITQFGDYFQYNDLIATGDDVSSVALLTATPTTFSLAVPSGLNLLVNYQANAVETSSNSSGFIRVFDPALPDYSPAAASTTANATFGFVCNASSTIINRMSYAGVARCNASGQLRAASDLNTTFSMRAIGWHDYQRRLAA